MVVDQEKALRVSPGVGAGGGAAARENRSAVVPSSSSLASAGGSSMLCSRAGLLGEMEGALQ